VEKITKNRGRKLRLNSQRIVDNLCRDKLNISTNIFLGLTMTQLVVYKSNWLIEAAYRTTLNEQRLILAVIAKVNPRNPMPKTFKLKAEEFLECFPLIGAKNAARELKKAAESLWERTIIVKDPKRKRWFRWIQERAEYKDGTVEITFSDQIVPYLINLRENFTRYQLNKVSNLKSIYSIRLFELIRQFEFKNERKIALEELKNILQIENKYHEFRDFNKWILKPSIKELNQKTSYVINVFFEKKLKRVTHIHFQFATID
jgi:plasmid replication initiation protein